MAGCARSSARPAIIAQCRMRQRWRARESWVATLTSLGRDVVSRDVTSVSVRDNANDLYITHQWALRHLQQCRVYNGYRLVCVGA